MAKDVRVSIVVAEVSSPLAADGGSTTLLDVEDGVAKVMYRQGHNEECPECIMSAADMREYLIEALAVHTPYIKDVELVLAEG